MEPRIEKLKQNLGNLSAKDKEFANSLMRQYSSRGSLSPRQWPWVETLADRKPAETKSLGGNLVPMLAMFQLTVEKGKKKAAISMRFGDDILRVSRAPDHGKNAGYLYVKSRQRGYLGKIHGKTGECHFLRQAPEGTFAALVEFSKNPLQAAIAYGKQVGECCFCEADLTDERSKAEGYGPTCADNYDLPWGNKRPEKRQ